MLFALPYILLTFFYGLLSIIFYAYDDENIRSKINITCIFIFVLFFGFRGYIFDDWINYYPSFEACQTDNIALLPTYEWSYELGFTLLILICKSIINDFQFLVFVCTIINITLLWTFLKKGVSNIPLAIMLYLAMGGLVMSVNLMRNTIAILIFINSLIYLEKRKALQYFLLCILALSFHMSSILFFPLYFILHRNCNKWIYLGAFILGNTILLLHIPILMSFVSIFMDDSSLMMANKIEDYTKLQQGIGFTISIGYLERLFTGLLIFCYIDKLKEIRKENIVFLNCILLYFLMFFIFSEFDEISRRLSNLFIFAYWILWYDLIKCFHYSNNRKLFITFISIYCLFKLIGTAGIATAKYENVLFGAQSYQERLFYYNRNRGDLQ